MTYVQRKEQSESKQVQETEVCRNATRFEDSITEKPSS